MTKGDQYTKETFERILNEGCWDKNPRPHYKDGTPAHTISVNHIFHTYDLTKGETPLITLRPIAIKSAIGEILWIYQDASNNLDLLRDKYGIKWWNEWDIGDRTIGSAYGETIREYDLTNKILLEGIKNNPDGRRHILSLWQYSQFEKPHGLPPCAFETHWNVRHGNDGIDYLDMKLIQRSSDFGTAGCINQVQYLVLLLMVARHHGYTPGRFTWDATNVQIYDRHIENAKEMLRREPIDCNPEIILNPEKTNFYDFTPDDIKIKGYPRKLIKEKNPQLSWEIAI